MGIFINFTGKPTLGNNNYTVSGYNYSIFFPCKTSISCAPYSILFKPGLYRINLFGAKGGDSTSNGKTANGGKGGQVEGYLRFKSFTKLLLYIGGAGLERSGKYGGYNGGGDADVNRGTGGGGTDLRMRKNDIESRLVVAGGGGAGYNTGTTKKDGGAGGGLSGSAGQVSSGLHPCIGTQKGCEKVNTLNVFSVGTKGAGGGLKNNMAGGGGGGYWGGGSQGSCGSSGGSSYLGGFVSIPTPITKSGINKGNGFAIISIISLESLPKSIQYHLYSLLFCSFLIGPDVSLD